MNRTIKFRAWDKKTKKMRKINSIAFDENGDIKVINLWGKDIINDKDIICHREKGVQLLQYTGLNDKNGKEIFESDIVNVKAYYDNEPLLAVVKFGEGIFDGGAYKFTGFYLDFGSNYQGEDTYQLDSKSVKHYEVVGNVYEDLKLLGKECI